MEWTTWLRKRYLDVLCTCFNLIFCLHVFWCMEWVLWVVMLNAIFNNSSVIPWRSVLLEEDSRVPGKPLICCKSLTNFTHNVVLSTPRNERNSHSRKVFKRTIYMHLIYLFSSCKCFDAWCALQLSLNINNFILRLVLYQLWKESLNSEWLICLIML
jgi:hypothetical protein